MAKSSPAVPAVDQFTITSIKDGAYKQAVASDRMRGVAKFVLDHSKGFPEVVQDEVKEQLYDGYRLRFNEVNPPEQYAIINDHYVLVNTPELAESREKVNIGVDYAFSFTQQQFGKMKNENPYLHAIIKSWRDRVNNYCSNRLADLKRQARAILNEGKTRERGATADFAKRLEDVFKDLRLKCDNAQKRGDETANKAKFDLARAAFMTTWSK